MRRCVLAIASLAVGVGVASCKKKASEATPPPRSAADAGAGDALPEVDRAEALAPASVALPATVMRLAADGTVTGTPPPPPPPAVDAGVEDDGAEESGGTGSTVLLEERSEPRAPDPQSVIRERFNGASHPARPSSGVPAFVPQRQGQAIGETLEDPLPASLPPLLIAAHPSAPATALIDLLAAHPALLAVSYQGTTRALRVAFGAREDARWNGNWTPWVEVRVGEDELTVEGVPGTPVVLEGPFDAAALGDAWRSALEPRRFRERVDVDVLVADGVRVQRLVKVLAALDARGARLFALGRRPRGQSDEMKKRGAALRFVQRLRVSMVGELEKSVVEATLDAAQPALGACWEQALARNPAAAGTVQTQFAIRPSGAVADVHTQGIDAEMASCVAKVIRGLTFPKPGDGGGVQVNAPLLGR